MFFSWGVGGGGFKEEKVAIGLSGFGNLLILHLLLYRAAGLAASCHVHFGRSIATEDE